MVVGWYGRVLSPLTCPIVVRRQGLHSSTQTHHEGQRGNIEEHVTQGHTRKHDGCVTSFAEPTGER